MNTRALYSTIMMNVTNITNTMSIATTTGPSAGMYVLGFVHKTGTGTTSAMYLTCKSMYNIWSTIGANAMINTMISRHSREYYPVNKDETIAWGHRILRRCPKKHDYDPVYYTPCGRHFAAMDTCEKRLHRAHCEVYTVRHQLKCVFVTKTDVINDVEYWLVFEGVSDVYIAMKCLYYYSLVPDAACSIVVKVVENRRKHPRRLVCGGQPHPIRRNKVYTYRH